jgi:hypothetical protein
MSMAPTIRVDFGQVGSSIRISVIIAISIIPLNSG